MIERRRKKTQGSARPLLEPRRPAGIQTMDRKLYELLQQALKGMACSRA